MLEYSLTLLLLLFIAGVCAGYVDTLAGGGGLITVPALMLTGVPIIAALATNKLQSSCGTFTASHMMFKRKKIRWKTVALPTCTAFVGSAGGTLLVQHIDTQALAVITPALLVCMICYFAFSPQPTQRRIRMLSARIYNTTIIPLIGSYDGIFGPGTGSVFAASAVSLRGYTLLQATVRAKVLNFATNFASLLVFFFSGHIAWLLGVVMLCGQLLGAYLGSRMLFRINTQILRWVVVCVCLAMLIKYIT